MIKLEESGHPVFRATSPLSRGTLKSKGGGQLLTHFCADDDTIETVFRTIISVNQLSIYGAVSDLCEEYSSCRTRTGRLVLAEQSDPLFASADLLITTPTPSIDIPAQEDKLQKHKERVEKLSQPDQLIKSFMTKHNDEFVQIAEPVTCREYALPRDEKLTDRKVGFKGHQNWARVGSHKDISHSWVRIYHGLNKLVTDLSNNKKNDNEQETSTTKTEAFAFASRYKALAQTGRPSTTCSSSRTVLITSGWSSTP